MSKNSYSPEEKAELAAAAARLGLSSPRIEPRRTRVNKKVRADAGRPKALHTPFRVDLKPREVRIDRSQVAVTEFAPVQIATTRNKNALSILRRRYAVAFSTQSITAHQLKLWREHVLCLSTDECAKFLRVTGRTISRWESGSGTIPWSVWYVMHITSSDEELKLARGGFEQFFVKNERGESRLMHEEYGDLHHTPLELLRAIYMAQQADFVETRNREARARIDALEAENAELRRMFKANSIVQELEAMQQRMAELVSRVSTADVLPFPQPATKKEAVA